MEAGEKSSYTCMKTCIRILEKICKQSKHIGGILLLKQYGKR